MVCTGSEGCVLLASSPGVFLAEGGERELLWLRNSCFLIHITLKCFCIFSDDDQILGIGILCRITVFFLSSEKC